MIDVPVGQVFAAACSLLDNPVGVGVETPASR